MKLLLITAITEFENDVKNILVKSGAKSFTYHHVRGFKNDDHKNVLENWFASSYLETESLLFTVFVSAENSVQILEKIKEFNAEQESLSNIHIALVHLEQQF